MCVIEWKMFVKPFPEKTPRKYLNSPGQNLNSHEKSTNSPEKYITPPPPHLRKISLLNSNATYFFLNCVGMDIATLSHVSVDSFSTLQCYYS